jgi:chromosome segregation ATPase
MEKLRLRVRDLELERTLVQRSKALSGIPRPPPKMANVMMSSGSADGEEMKRMVSRVALLEKDLISEQSKCENLGLALEENREILRERETRLKSLEKCIHDHEMETRRLGMLRDVAQEEAKQLGRKIASLEGKMGEIEHEKESQKKVKHAVIVSTSHPRMRSQHSQSDMTSQMIDRWAKGCESAKDSRREQFKRLTKDHQLDTKKRKDLEKRTKEMEKELNQTRKLMSRREGKEEEEVASLKSEIENRDELIAALRKKNEDDDHDGNDDSWKIERQGYIQHMDELEKHVWMDFLFISVGVHQHRDWEWKTFHSCILVGFDVVRLSNAFVFVGLLVSDFGIAREMWRS